jgi:hypothetical protein
MEAQRKFPSREILLETRDAMYYHFKTDVFKNQMQYSTDKHIAANLVTISSERAYEVINLNKKGHKPQFLNAEEEDANSKKEYQDVLEESVSRFDSLRKKNKNKNRKFSSPPKIVKKRNNDSV